MALTFVCAFGLVGTLAILWPATYRSTGTILIEQQEIPTDVVRSAVTSYADQRVQVISQRVMTSSNLLGIIDKYNLYSDTRATATREALTQKMRDNVHLQMISADVVDPRQGRATKATIAFSISYDSHSPVTAARVANELTTLYLSENIESRKLLAANTADFLTTEAARLGLSVASLEAKLATFKEKYGERLPEYQQFNLSTVESHRGELRDIETRIRSMDQQVTFLDAQLAQTSAFNAMFTRSGERLLSTADQLKLLRTQLTTALTTYTSEHPTVVNLRSQIEGLEQSLAELPPVNSHPDNPAFIQLTAQKAALLNERAALQGRGAEVRGRITAIEARQAGAPVVEQEYSALMRELTNERSKYSEVHQKQLEAQLVQNLETERKGERFTLIEPPIQPNSPVSPNRKLIVIMAFLLATVMALGVAFLLEQLDDTIRDRAHLVRLLGVAPLAQIPVIAFDKDANVSRRKTRKLRTAAASLAGILIILACFRVQPLETLWLTLAGTVG